MRYELFDAALRAAGIHRCDHDEFIDHGDLLALIHPAVKALLLNRVVPDLSRFLIDYNASLTPLAIDDGDKDPTQMRVGETARSKMPIVDGSIRSYRRRLPNAGLRNVSANRGDGETPEMFRGTIELEYAATIARACMHPPGS